MSEVAAWKARVESLFELLESYHKDHSAERECKCWMCTRGKWLRQEIISRCLCPECGEDALVHNFPNPYWYRCCSCNGLFNKDSIFKL